MRFKKNMKLCDYGCNQEAKYYFPTVNKWCCSKFTTQCFEVRRKNSENSKGKSQSEEHKRKLSKIRKGKPTWNKGKKMSDEWRNRVGKNFLDKKHTSKTKKKMRYSSIQRIEEQFLNNEPLTPCIGKEERLFLNEVESILNTKVHRQFSVSGFFVDGYIPKLNLAFEFDEEINHKDVSKDLQRQQEIEESLNCKFFRVNDYKWKKDKKEIIRKIKELKHDLG